MLNSSRSQFLVHWTGKDIDTQRTSGAILEESWRLAYVDRLLQTLKTGLWLTQARETVGGGLLEFQNVNTRVCFSEILLSRSGEHARRYGQLGFGFSRRFVLDAGGSPVLYVRNADSDRVLRLVGALRIRLHNVIELSIAEMPEGVHTFPGLQDLFDANALTHRLLAFMKGMSLYGADDFDFLDEAEWRIVCFDDHPVVTVQDGTFVSLTPNGPVRSPVFSEHTKRPAQITINERWSPQSPPYFLSFQPDDLALLAVPDEPTRSLVWKDDGFQLWLRRRSTPLHLLTLDECVRL